MASDLVKLEPFDELQSLLRRYEQEAENETERDEESQSSVTSEYDELEQDLAPESTTFRADTASLLIAMQSLKEKLPKSIPSQRKKAWEKTLDKSLRSTEPRSTVVALMGQSGAGKSSLINALLEYPFVPISDCQACTACPIQISWHDGDEIILEIEFLQRDDWNSEVEMGLQDLLDISEEGTRVGSEAALAALHKLKAVYGPAINIQPCDIKESTAEDLVANASPYLGTQIRLQCQNAEELIQKARQYMMPKPLTAERLPMPDTQNMISGMSGVYETWPLVKIVRIKANIPMLSKGLVLVDLPGVGDSNAGREAIARQFAKSCDCTVIVSLITRACTNKSTQELFTSESMTNLRMDGALESGKVIIVCSQSDVGIFIDDSRTYAYLNEKDAQDIKHLQESIQALEAEQLIVRRDQTSKLEELSTARQQLEELQSQRQQFENNFSSSPSRATSSTPSPRKKRRVQTASNLDFNQVQSKMEEVVSYTTGQIAVLDNEKSQLDMRRFDIITRLAQQKKKVRTVCILARNAAVKIGMATGLDEVAGQQISLRTPFFTVSAEQAVAFKRGSESDYFDNISQTELPSLRKHLTDASEENRKKQREDFVLDCRYLVDDIEAFFSSMTQVDLHEKNVIVAIFSQEKDTLKEDLRKAVQQHVKIANTVAERLHGQLDKAITQARANATEAALFVRSDIDAVRHWSTFKAFCRRDGHHDGMDWNRRVLRPLWTTIADHWKEVFVDRSSELLDNVLKDINLLLIAYMETIKTLSIGVGPILRDILSSVGEGQLKQANNSLRTVISDTRSFVHTKQQDLRETITRLVQKALAGGYNKAHVESGKGAVDRGKKHILDALNKDDGRIFTDSGSFRRINRYLQGY